MVHGTNQYFSPLILERTNKVTTFVCSWEHQQRLVFRDILTPVKKKLINRSEKAQNGPITRCFVYNLNCQQQAWQSHEAVRVFIFISSTPPSRVRLY